MAGQKFTTHRLGNGITLIGEEMEGVSSAAISVLVPLGAATDPTGEDGATSLLLEMMHKGAGQWDSRALSDEFEKVGLQHGHSSGVELSSFSCVGLADHLERGIELLSEVMLAPTLPEGELKSVRELALQDLNSLEDEPSQKVMVELAKRYYPEPFGRSQYGTVDGVNRVSVQSLKQYYSRAFAPARAIIGVAGKFNWERIKALVEKRFSSWKGAGVQLPAPNADRTDRAFHLEKDTSQMQIALAYPSVAFDHKDYYVARVATGVLSGGMAGRLFIEVREKRGLVYHVSASHSAARGRGAIFAYAGTTPKHAEETLSVMLTELRKLADGVSAEELERSKTDLKAKVVMQSELTSSRSSSLVNDWWNLGRVRTVEEIKQEIDRVTDADIRRHLKDFPVSGITMVTLGNKALELRS